MVGQVIGAVEAILNYPLKIGVTVYERQKLAGL